MSEKETTLIGCLQDVPDPRHPYNQKHNFIDVIVIVVTAILAGMETWDEMADWARAKEEWFRTFLELPNGIPSHDTLNRVFQMIDPKKFHDAFFKWVDGVVETIQGVVAFDGKTMRRSREEKSGQRPAHIVSAWAAEASLVLGQVKVDEKSNEITAIPELIDMLCLKGCIVTIDAMGTQHEIAKAITEKEADYILQVKGNQKELQSDIQIRFERDIFTTSKKELLKQERYYKDLNNEHGRLEIREYYVENNAQWLAERHPEWLKLFGIGACVSTVEKNGEKTQFITYSIYSCEMTAEEFGKRKRLHWQIENGLHWILDVAFREDESRMRAGNAAENVNIARHIGINLLKQDKSCKMGIKSKRKKCGYDQQYLLKVLSKLNNRIE